MNKFKKLFFCVGIFFCSVARAEDRFDNLEQKIKYLEALIIAISQNMALQQELIQLLQKQLQANLTIEESHDDEISLENHPDEEDHHLLLRIPKWLMAKVDAKRKLRVGKISRNLWILETLDEATKK